jgi:hypothetical protein
MFFIYKFALRVFHAIVFYNEADTLESSLILIYSCKEQSIYTWCDRHDAV